MQTEKHYFFFSFKQQMDVRGVGEEACSRMVI